MKQLIIVVALASFVYSCSDKADYLVSPNLASEPINTSDLSFTVLNDNIAADGISAAELLVTAGPSILSKYHDVNVKVSSIGKLPNGSDSMKLQLDIIGEAHVYVSAGAIGKSLITATVGNYTKNATVIFVAAGPDYVHIETDAAIMAPRFDAKLNVKARLIRTPGLPSPDQSLNFYDSTTTGTSVGVFLNSATSNVQGEITTEYRLTDTSYHGPLYLKGFLMFNGKRIQGSTRVMVQ